MSIYFPEPGSLVAGRLLQQFKIGNLIPTSTHSTSVHGHSYQHDLDMSLNLNVHLFGMYKETREPAEKSYRDDKKIAHYIDNCSFSESFIITYDNEKKMLHKISFFEDLPHFRLKGKIQNLNS